MSHPSREQLERHHKHALSETLSAKVDTHLIHCEECRKILNEVSKPVARPASGGFFGEFFRSPQLVLMLIGGLALIAGATYMAFRTLPDVGSDAGAESNVPDVPLDLSELDQLPATVDEARLVVAAGQPELPQILLDVPPELGNGLVYPVLETVESTRPALSWQPIGPPPYTIVLTDARRQVVARGEHLPNPQWTVGVELQRGAIYTWQMTAPDGTNESASFKVLGEEEARLWQGLRVRFANSHLALGAVAQYLGLLTVAEREFREVANANPNSQQAGLLLDNVLALRDTEQEIEPQ